MRTLRKSGILLVLVALVTAGCGGGGGSHATGSTTTTTVESTAAEVAQVKTVWQTFFSSTGTAGQIQGMNPQLQQAYDKATSTLFPKGLTADVASVVPQTTSSCQTTGVPSPCAAVTYSLFVDNSPELPNAQGYAVEVGGQWLVAKSTFCALDALGNGGTEPAGC